MGLKSKGTPGDLTVRVNSKPTIFLVSELIKAFRY